MPYKVRFVEPDTHYLQIKGEVDSAIQDILARGDLICRNQLAEFEKNLAAFVGTRYAVGLNSGFHALHLSLIAAGIGQGDEVIVPAHTFVACVSAIVHVGAKPILVDVVDDYNINPGAVERVITRKTKVIMPVHLNGCVCRMDLLMDLAKAHKLIIIEDAAQALGASFKQKRAGSFGRTGCFSFYPFKVLGAFGDSGAITTNDEEIALKVTRLRYNGEDRRTGEYYHHGFTCLMDNLQAAILNVKLRHLPEWLRRRRQIACWYSNGLANVGDLRLPHFEDNAEDHVYQNYVVRTKRRDGLVSYLRDHGVEVLVHWPKPMWEHKGLGLGMYTLPETEAICREVLSLPINSEISDESVQYVITTVRNFFTNEYPPEWPHGE